GLAFALANQSADAVAGFFGFDAAGSETLALATDAALAINDLRLRVGAEGDEQLAVRPQNPFEDLPERLGGFWQQLQRYFGEAAETLQDAVDQTPLETLLFGADGDAERQQTIDDFWSAFGQGLSPTPLKLLLQLRGWLQNVLPDADDAAPQPQNDADKDGAPPAETENTSTTAEGDGGVPADSTSDEEQKPRGPAVPVDVPRDDVPRSQPRTARASTAAVGTLIRG
ncbi:MAG: hypothetical protein KY476_25950, partial [Planctomycetes bacterium]|nr:hypothetical protein [Planctomycetota bacterium]